MLIGGDQVKLMELTVLLTTAMEPGGVGTGEERTQRSGKIAGVIGIHSCQNTKLTGGIENRAGAALGGPTYGDDLYLVNHPRIQTPKQLSSAAVRLFFNLIQHAAFKQLDGVRGHPPARRAPSQIQARGGSCRCQTEHLFRNWREEEIKSMRNMTPHKKKKSQKANGLMHMKRF